MKRSSTSTSEISCSDLLLIGKTRIEQGDYDKAISILTQTIERCPNILEEAYFQRGCAHEKNGNPIKAAEDHLRSDELRRARLYEEEQRCEAKHQEAEERRNGAGTSIDQGTSMWNSIGNWIGSIFSVERQLRHTHCWKCKKRLRTETHKDCETCRWILCVCGACGCNYKY